MPAFSVEDVYVGESESFAEFVVRLDAPATSAVTVNWQTGTYTASAGGDFTSSSGFLTFAAGETVKTVRVPVVNDATAEAVEAFTLQLYSPSANATLARPVALATIIDNDAPSGTPVVSINDFVVDEAGREATFVITLDRPSTSTVSVNYATQNGTALAGSDYTTTSGSLKFAAGETVKVVKVPLLNDTAAEGLEAFNLVLSGLVGATSLDPVGTAVIEANDAPAVAKPNLLVEDIYVGESAGFAEFVVRLDAPATSAVTVNWQTGSYTASAGGDFTSSSGFLTFAAGETVKTVRVPVVNDATAEAVEAFTLELYSPSANATLARPVALATIIDNDAPSGTPVVSINDFVVDEAGREATFVITLDRPSTSTVSVNYATQNGTALAGSDYTTTSGSLKFAAGETVKVVKVPLLNDTAAEGLEAFNLVLSGLVGATSLDPVGTAVIEANDAPAVAKPNLLVEDIYVGESAGFAEFVVRLDAPATSAVTVNWQTGSYTASAGGDFTSSSGFLTFAAGETVKTVRVPVVNDATAEAVEAFTLELYSPSANATLARPVALATIIDNDAPSGTPVVSINDFVVDEAGREATFVITLDRPSTSTVSVNYATQNGTALAGSDYTTTSGSLKFAAGETVKVVKVPLLNDTAAEGLEAFNLVLSGLVGATSLDPVGTAMIEANDAPAVAKPNLLVEDIYVGESAGFAEFVVRLDAPATSAVTVNWQTGTYTASAGGDFTSSSGFLTFAAGETVKTVRVPVVNDATAEAVEAFTLELYSPSANATLARPVALATIIDNDAPSGTPVVSINDFVVDEAGREATFVITLDRPSTSTVSVNYATQNGTALAGSDYTTTSGSLKFAAGETVKVVKVPLLNDTAAEGLEAFNLVLSGLVGATSLDPVGTAVIEANDAPAVTKPNLLVEDIYVGESAGFAEFVVRLDAPATSAVTVNWQTGTYTASAGGDFTSSSGFLTFAAGETVKTVRVPVVNDATAEAVEAFTLELYSPSANATLARPVALATIIDNDAPSGTPVVSINDFVVDEAGREATFVITLDRPSTSTVSVNYATQNGTALAGSDYTTTSGSLKFAAGETVKVVKVPLLNDTAAEGLEAFNLVLSGLVGATSLDPVGTAVIAKNDNTAVSTARIGIADTSVTEDGPFAVFTVTLEAPATSAVTVNWQTGTNTASAGGDFTSSSGFLTFAAGETVKTIRVPIVNDTTAEAVEAFTLQLYSPSANATLARPVALATIIDDDDASVQSSTVDGTSSADAFIGSKGIDRINANGGDDYILSSLGNDVFDGGAGIDTVDYSGKTVAITVALNAGSDVSVRVGSVVEDTIRNVENIVGGSGADTMTGDGLSNVFLGAGGNDTLKGLGGSDTLDGGTGVDKADYSEKTASVVVTLAGATDALVRVGGVVEDTIRNIEDIAGGSAADTLTGDGLANGLTGNGGNDILKGMGGADTLDGGAGSDTADYSDKTTAVVVTLNGATNAGVSVGGVAEDTIRNIENVTGGSAADRLTGDGSANTLFGAGGNDILKGMGGADILDGGAGSDTADYSDKTTAVVVTLNGATNAGVSVGGVVEDTIRNMENITGGSAADTLTGDGSANTLSGGLGADGLNGGAGADVLTGGAGADRFIFTTALAASNIDTISDFNAVDDVFWLDDAIFSALSAGSLTSADFVTGTAASNASQNIIYDKANGRLFYDADGNGSVAQVQFATVTANIDLTAGDFFVI